MSCVVFFLKCSKLRILVVQSQNVQIAQRVSLTRSVLVREKKKKSPGGLWPLTPVNPTPTPSAGARPSAPIPPHKGTNITQRHCFDRFVIPNPTALRRRTLADHGGTSFTVGTGCSAALLVFFPDWTLTYFPMLFFPPVSTDGDWWSLRERELQPPTDFIHPAWSHAAWRRMHVWSVTFSGYLQKPWVSSRVENQFDLNSQDKRKSLDPLEAHW